MTLAQALAKLHAAGRIRSPWLPGMRAILDRGIVGGRMPFRRSDDGVRWLFPSDSETANSIVDRDAEPDTSDAATVGCLLALLREAGDSLAYVSPVFECGGSADHWECYCGEGVYLEGTEGAAIESALIALAGGL